MELRDMYRDLVPAGLRTLHVDAARGDDRNDGSTLEAPFASITRAAAEARPGDRLLVGEGRYGYTSVYGVVGTPDAWISIEAGGRRDRTVVSVEQDAGRDGVDIQRSAHVGLFGFEVRGSVSGGGVDASGIAVFRGSSFIRVWGNEVHHFPGGGVNCHFVPATRWDGDVLPAGGWDCVDVAFNHVHDCCGSSPYNTSGISFFGAQDLTGGATLDGRHGYRALGNQVHDCVCDVPYSIGGLPFVTDGNGISVDALAVPNALSQGNPPYTKRGLIEANLVVRNGGRGLHVFDSVHVEDVHNTYAENLRTRSPAIDRGAEADAEFGAPVSRPDVHHTGNLILPVHVDRSTDEVSEYRHNIVLGGRQRVRSEDVDRRSQGFRYFRGPFGDRVADDSDAVRFTPVDPDRVPPPEHAAGVDLLGRKRPSGRWTAGAIEVDPLEPL